jgi:hypothetical protein
MNRKILSYSVGAAAVLFGLAACSSDNATSSGGTPNSAEVTSGARQGAGEGAAMTLAELNANENVYGASADVANGAAAVVSPTTVNCGGPDDNGWYNCTAVLDSGVHLTITRSIRFWAGTNYDLWWNNPSPTDSVNHKWTVDGTLDAAVRAGRNVTVDDSNAATLIVLRVPAGVAAVANGAQHVWNGTAAQHHVATYTPQGGDERILTQTGYDTVAAVTFQMPRSQNPFPLSGVITINETTHFTAGSYDQTDTRHLIVTFNGTNIATLQDGGITCDLDLTTHDVSNCH